MNTLERIIDLSINQDVRISEHGYDELANDNLTAREVISGVLDAVLIEDYPEYKKGASVLVLQKDHSGKAIHVVWGIPIGYDKPAVLITAYKPNPELWGESLMERKRK